MKFALLLSFLVVCFSPSVSMADVAGNGQGSDLVGGDVGGNSQDIFGRHWSRAILRMNDSNLVNGRYGVNGRVAEIAEAVHELYVQKRPEPQDLGELIPVNVTPSQLVEAVAKRLLERLDIHDPRTITDIAVLLGADR